MPWYDLKVEGSVCASNQDLGKEKGDNVNQFELQIVSESDDREEMTNEMHWITMLNALAFPFYPCSSIEET